MNRAEEEAYKRGFDAGVKHQREAALPLKARALKRRLDVVMTHAHRLFNALRHAEERHINVECKTCDGETGCGCRCSGPMQWRAVLGEAKAAPEEP